MGAFFSFFQVEADAAGNNLLPVRNKVADQLLERQRLRPPIHQRKVDNAEGGLERCLGKELIQHHLCDCSPLQLDNQP